MRLLLLNRYYANVGGLERYFSEVTPLLEQLGVRVTILYGKEVEGGLQFPGREEICLPTLFDPRVGRDVRIGLLKDHLQRVDADVIQIHQMEDPSLIRVCAASRPTVHFVHGQSPYVCPGEGRFAKWPETVCQRKVGSFCLVAPYLQFCGSRRPAQILANYRMSREYLATAPLLSRILVASQYMRDLLAAEGVPEARLMVTPLPFVGQSPNPGVPQRPRSILFVGRMTPHKGTSYLLRAMTLLPEGCSVTLVGDGPLRGDLESSARQLLAGRHHVTFTGWLSHEAVAKLYWETQVVAFPSVWPEPFGRVGLEASGHGRPVVAFDVGGVRDWLAHGHNGFLVPPKDTAGFAEALKRLLRDDALRQTMGENGLELVRTRFNPTQHVETMLSLYNEISAAPGHQLSAGSHQQTTIGGRPRPDP